MVIIGCCWWNSAAIFFISGSLPSQGKNVTVVGEVGSATGPWPSPFGGPDGLSGPPQAARLIGATAAAAAAAATFRDSLNLTESAPLLFKWLLGDRRCDPMQIVWLLGGKHRQHPPLCQWIRVLSVTSVSHRDARRAARRTSSDRRGRSATG